MAVVALSHRNWFILFGLVATLGNPCFAAPDISREDIAALWRLPPAIEEQLALPEESIDIARTALTFEKVTRPGLDVEFYLRRIEELAEKVRALNTSRGGNSKLWSIEQVFKDEGFQYNFSPNLKQNYESHSLTGFLDSKLGYCDSMTVLYLAVAQRVGLRPYPVNAPSHVFVRYPNTGWKSLFGKGENLNVEVTSGGTFADAEMIEKRGVPEAGIKSGAYMRTLSYREFMAWI